MRLWLQYPGGIQEQKEDTSEKPGEIQIKSE